MNKLKILFIFNMIFSLCLISFFGIIQAQNGEYQADIYEAEIIPTIDGKWTDALEWSDAIEYQLDGSLDVRFRVKKVSDDQGQLETLYFLVEFFNDTTNDVNDYTNICLFVPETSEDVPPTGIWVDENCKQFEYDDLDSGSPFKYFTGSDGGWMINSSYTWEADILVVESFTASPTFNENHSIMEWRISAQSFGITPDFLLRVATVDMMELNHFYGSQIWPYSHNAMPEQWGTVLMHDKVIDEDIPEFPSWIILPLFLVISLVALVSRKSLRKCS